MRKQYISLLGLVAALLVSGQASAGLLGSPNEIFIGGATAVQRTFHLDVMLRFCNWDGNVNDADGVITPRIYTDLVKSLPGGGNATAATPPLGVADQIVIHCNFKPSLGGNLAGAEVAVYKFNGGSGTGVAPVANPATAPASDQQYLDPDSSCVLKTNSDVNNLWTSVDGVTRFQLLNARQAVPRRRHLTAVSRMLSRRSSRVNSLRDSVSVSRVLCRTSRRMTSCLRAT